MAAFAASACCRPPSSKGGHDSASGEPFTGTNAEVSGVDSTPVGDTESPGASAACSACTNLLPPQQNVTDWSDARLDDEWTYHATEQMAGRLSSEPFEAQEELTTRSDLLDWQLRTRETFLSLLRVDAAAWPDTPLKVRYLQSDNFDGYVRHKIDYLVEPGQRIPAYLFVPSNGPRPGPAVLFWHGHGDGGKDQAAGIPPYTEADDYHHAGAERLAQAGYIVLAPDVRSFGETGSYHTGDWKQHEHFTQMLLLHGRVALGVFLEDAKKALDVLESLPEVDGTRIGVGGVSLGGQLSLYLAATDPRIKVAVVQGYLASFHGTDLSWLHCVCQYIPMMGRTMDFSDIAMLAAPTPLRFVMGNRDPRFTPTESQEQFDRLEPAWDLLDAGDHLSMVRHAGGHEWIEDAAEEWFDRFLRP